MKPAVFDRVLVAIDNSPQASGVVAAAASLASKYGSEVMVVHVQEPVTAETGDHIETLRDCEELVGWALDELEKQGVHGGAECLPYSLRETAQGKRILEAAQTFKADLVILGSRGHSTVGGLIGGSVSRTVTKDATCSVMVVR
ncbi:MAG TPA: universal stress protein [Candidatus Udaeobacter sp.]|nr:universal stress protein [Candidatus Udaeobacter sp.]